MTVPIIRAKVVNICHYVKVGLISLSGFRSPDIKEKTVHFHASQKVRWAGPVVDCKSTPLGATSSILVGRTISKTVGALRVITSMYIG